jgi:hypothetical protein
MKNKAGRKKGWPTKSRGFRFYVELEKEIIDFVKNKNNEFKIKKL